MKAAKDTKAVDLGHGFKARFLPCGGLEIRGGHSDDLVCLDRGQALKLRAISAAAIAAEKRATDVQDWQAVARLCAAIQSEIDGDAPIHSTDTHNALNEVQCILREG